jgi:hypothetical protein
VEAGSVGAEIAQKARGARVVALQERLAAGFLSAIK